MSNPLRIIIFIHFLAVINFGQIVPSDNNSNMAASDTLAYLNIPERSDNAIGGTEFALKVTGFTIEDREKAIVGEILSGNVPSFARKLKRIQIVENINSNSFEVIFFAVCDYMAIGSDEDYLYIPMTPSTAQYLATQLNCTLPTKKIVDIIYSNAEIKLKPQPIAPSDKMTSLPVFIQHTDSIKQQISQIGIDRSTNKVIGGHKKDVIISNKIYSTDRNYDRVVIYGWHLSENNPIQPVYNGHIAQYADYSHGIRLISEIAFLNGDTQKITKLLQDPNYARLLSSEGVISRPYYPESDIFSNIRGGANNLELNFNLYQNFPNPFNPSTIINYSIPNETHLFVPSRKGNARSDRGVLVTIKVYDVLGKEIATLVDEKHSLGNYDVEFNATNLPSGVYFYRLRVGDASTGLAQSYTETKKMVLLR